MTTTVHVRACSDYDRNSVREILLDAFDTFGGLGELYPAKGRILVKPNLVRGASAERAVTTHPVVIVETVRILREGGREVLVAESPGIGNARSHIRKLGCLEELESLGAEVRGLRHPVATKLASGHTVGLSRDALEAGGILNLAKWKTHVQVGMTGAVKNCFGCLVGPRKAWQHISYGHHFDEFQAMLLGIAQAVNPSLHVVDGVVAMEGNGPMEGIPKPVGFILSGRDPVALDRILSDRMDLGDLRMFRVAREMGLGETDVDTIRLTGDSLPHRIDPPFVPPKPSPLTFHPIRRLLCGSLANPDW